MTDCLFAVTSTTPKGSVVSGGTPGARGEKVSVPDGVPFTAVPDALQCTVSVLSTLSPDESARVTK